MALTREQQNEHESRSLLADTLNKLRAHTGGAIRDLEDALEVLRNVERAIESVPDELDADSIDLAELAKAVRAADDEQVEAVHVRSIQDDVNRVRGDLSEAVGQIDYLLAGDFGE